MLSSPGSEVRLRNILSSVALLVVAATAACADDGDNPLTADARVTAGDASVTDAQPGSPDAATIDATPFVCDIDSPQPPPGSVLWPAALSASGAQTLNGHGHDDGFGAVGYCPGTPVSGQPFYQLIAAGFETDEDINGSNGNADFLPVDFWRDPGSFVGMGESAGRVNIYIDVVDESGTVLNVDSNPEIRLLRSIHQGPEDALPLTSKPANEFQTNLPMTGGGTRYSLSIQGSSDRVVNMRLPVNHHVTFILIFRRIADPP